MGHSDLHLSVASLWEVLTEIEGYTRSFKTGGYGDNVSDLKTLSANLKELGETLSEIANDIIEDIE